MQTENFKANASYKELLTQLAFKEAELESKERIAKMSKTS